MSYIESSTSKITTELQKMATKDAVDSVNSLLLIMDRKIKTIGDLVAQDKSRIDVAEKEINKVVLDTNRVLTSIVNTNALFQLHVQKEIITQDIVLITSTIQNKLYMETPWYKKINKAKYEKNVNIAVNKAVESKKQELDNINHSISKIINDMKEKKKNE